MSAQAVNTGYIPHMYICTMMKGTARALFTVAMSHWMCYEIICDHIHNSVDHIYNQKH